jgi:membrane protein implicated in regulation of membrane protease activity
MKAKRGQPPEPTELVYLPRPSWLPAFAALGIALVVVGLFSWWVYAVFGAVIGLVSIIAWIRHAAAETSRLPREQRPRSAVLPAVPLRRRD